MPITINEIEIAVEVIPAATAGGQAGSPSTDELVKECVEKVMEIINQKKER